SASSRASTAPASSAAGRSARGGWRHARPRLAASSARRGDPLVRAAVLASPSVRTVLGASLLTTVGTLPVFLLATQSVPLRHDLGFGERQFGVAVAAFFAAASLVAVLRGGG